MKNTDNTWKHIEHGLPLTSSEKADGGWKQDASESLAKGAMLMATISIASAFLIPFFVPLILAVLAIILAILSKGRQHRLEKTGRRAIIMALAGIVVNAAVVGSLARSAMSAAKDPFAHARLNQSVESLYGQSFDDMVRQFDQNYGTDLESVLGISAGEVQ